MEYQEIVENICKHFSIPDIPLKVVKELDVDVLGEYWVNEIKIDLYASISTILHELAHHLEFTRYNKRTNIKHGKIFKNCLKIIEEYYDNFIIS